MSIKSSTNPKPLLPRSLADKRMMISRNPHDPRPLLQNRAVLTPRLFAKYSYRCVPQIL